MKLTAKVALISLTLASQAHAHESNVVRVSKPTADQIAAAREKADSFIETLESGETEAAIRQVAAGSSLLEAKSQEINLLIGQANNAESLYGPIKKCALSKYAYESELRVRFNYVCQHRELLLEWKLTVDRLPAGWTISLFSFSDSF